MMVPPMPVRRMALVPPTVMLIMLPVPMSDTDS